MAKNSKSTENIELENRIAAPANTIVQDEDMLINAFIGNLATKSKTKSKKLVHHDDIRPVVTDNTEASSSEGINELPVKSNGENNKSKKKNIYTKTNYGTFNPTNKLRKYKQTYQSAFDRKFNCRALKCTLLKI
jgi:hypothetical protein